MPRLRPIVSVAFVAFSLLNLMHYIANEIWRPFTGPLDTAFHLMYPLGVVVGAVSLLAAAEGIVARIRSWRFSCTLAFAALVLAIEFAGSFLMPIRDVGASSYRRLLPDFLAGPLIAIACVSAARSLLHLPRFRWSAVVLIAGWVSGSLLVDALWWTERGSRGTGPLWRVPVIDQLWQAPATVAAGAYEALRFAGGWMWCCVAAGVLISIAAAPRGSRAQGLVFGLCWAFLIERFADWGNFILD